MIRFILVNAQCHLVDFWKKRPANFNFISLEWNSYNSSIQIHIVWSLSSIFKLKSSTAQGCFIKLQLFTALWWHLGCTVDANKFNSYDCSLKMQSNFKAAFYNTLVAPWVHSSEMYKSQNKALFWGINLFTKKPLFYTGFWRYNFTLGNDQNDPPIKLH